MLAVTRFGDAGIALPALVAVNLLPLCGVLFFNWSVYEVLLLYWSENIIIGVFNLARFWTVLRRRGDYSVLFLGPFFCVHYGGFAFGHLVFLRSLFGADSGGGELSGMFAASFLALLASHAISHVVNFIGPWRRLALLLGGTILGGYLVKLVVTFVAPGLDAGYPAAGSVLNMIVQGWLVIPPNFMVVGNVVTALAVLVLVKLGMDIVAHRREHRRLQAQVADAA